MKRYPGKIERVSGVGRYTEKIENKRQRMFLGSYASVYGRRLRGVRERKRNKQRLERVR